MSRRDLPTRTRTQLTQLVAFLDRTGQRVTVLAAGALGVLALHASLGDTRMAWLSVPVVLLAGLATSLRAAMVVALLLATAHAAIDVAVVGVPAGQLTGVGVRSVVLPGLALVGNLIADLEQQRHRAMERVVSEDPVTGLLNVRIFYEELATRRAAGEPFTILLADLRGMRGLNDRYGHPTGTEAVRVLAHVLRRAAGRDSHLARLGSDEIAVLLTGTEPERARAIVRAAIDRLDSEQVRLPDGAHFAVHASYGVATFPEDGEDEVAVLRAAETAKEQAKPSGLDPIGIAGDAGDPANPGDDGTGPASP
jgi:diguanylate cyclase (GGDEF)-like protein